MLPSAGLILIWVIISRSTCITNTKRDGSAVLFGAYQTLGAPGPAISGSTRNLDQGATFKSMNIPGSALTKQSK